MKKLLYLIISFLLLTNTNGAFAVDYNADLDGSAGSPKIEQNSGTHTIADGITIKNFTDGAMQSTGSAILPLVKMLNL